MNLHEYQAKRLFAEAGIPVPDGSVVTAAEEAGRAARDLGGERWVVKAQVHAGGRGKAGGVELTDSADEVARAAERMLGSMLTTHQTGPEGVPVGAVLIERAQPIARELYLSALVDRARERVVLMGSASGGVDIEEVASSAPEQIRTTVVSPAAGFQPYQARRLGFAMGLNRSQIGQLVAISRGLCRLVMARDASLAEINPLIVTEDGNLLALDAKLNVDDNALFRHEDIAAMRDPSQEPEREREAREHDLSYVSLDGDIGCMVNGAGLAMATMDVIKLEGGNPANFLDVGGGTTSERVAAAFKLIVSDSGVRAILINIFGGIVRCDLIAEGIITAVGEVGVNVPVVVRLEGTNAEQGRRMLDDSDFELIAAEDLGDAARKVVGAARS